MKSKMRTWNVAMGSLSLLFLCVSPALAIATNPSQENPSTERKDNSVTQQRTRKVTGVVLDANGESIIGANVVVKGTNNGTITDLDGKFSIELSDGETLQVSFIGYNSKDVMVGAGENHIKVQLREDTQKLDEVVVVGYGTQIKRAVTGSVQSIKSEEMADMPVAQISQKMQGKFAGVQINQVSGKPGQGMTMRIRGQASLSGGTTPLYVVDGVPLDNTNFGSAGTNGGFDLGDGISSINADDVENMSVLKGPAASALYGSRASHGVILITTKRANKDKISVEYNGTLTFDTQLAKWDEVQQIYGMGSNGTYSYDAISNTNKSWGPKADGSNMLKYFDGVERPFLIVPDNTSNFFRTGITATNSAIIGVNSGKTGIRFTYTDMRNKDIVPQTHMSRDIFNLRANTSAGKVDLDFSVNYTREDVKNRPALGDSKSNIGKNLMTLATTYDQEWLQTYQTADG